MNEFRRKNSHHGPSVEKLKFDKSSGSYINAKDENWASKIAKSEINIIKRYFWNLYNNKSMYYLNKKQNLVEISKSLREWLYESMREYGSCGINSLKIYKIFTCGIFHFNQTKKTKTE